jgi:cytoplasmic iron level regulating protein YaaA (DUF328/UPF0246 family)
MKLLISPAKSLEFDKALPTQQTTVPVFQNDAGYINSVLKKNSVEELGKLMHLSEKLAHLNWDRNQAFSGDSTQSRAAVYAFNGDVYTGLDAYTLEEDKIGQMQKRLRILSGLYGVLKPLDAIRAYRLEMGTTLKLGAFENLYAFWKEKISSQLQTELQKDELVVNLASKEYFSAVDTQVLSNQIISPQFKDFKNGKLKIISFFAKKARGMMARHLIDQQANTLEEILSFNKEGYAFSASETEDPMSPVFVR